MNALPAFGVPLVDAILLLVAVEAVVLLVIRARWRRGPTARQTISFLASGAALLVALRVSLAGGPRVVALAALLAAGVAHAWHLLLDDRAQGPPRT